MIVKPFKGPIPLGPDDSIYGRQDDIEALVDILLSDRIILLCSASGAGKTSLLQAGLNKATEAVDDLDREAYGNMLKRLGCMARMRLRGFQVLPTIRVDTPLPDKTIGSRSANRFIFSMLNHLEQMCLEETIPSEDLTAIDLNFYFEQRVFLKNTDEPKLMVFDQFEELIHKDPSDIEAKEVFLNQVGRVLENPRYWAIFAMRSEYVTDFDEYLHLLPTGLSSRFTLQLLTQRGAYDAITKPLLESEAANRIIIDEKAALKLVSDLSADSGGEMESKADLSAKPTIEPLHLQVVCDSLWSRALKTDQIISESTIAQSGGVDKTLEHYAEDQLRIVSERIASQKPGEPVSAIHTERILRKWIETTLISSQKTRNSVYDDDERVRRLNDYFQKDDILPELCDTYLIRRDARNKRNLYEVSHDRLVEIIIENNERWFEHHLNAFQRNAERWERDNNPKLLLEGATLRKAQKWLRNQPTLETVLESKYIGASKEFSKKRNKRIVVALFLIIFLIISTITSFALFIMTKKTNIQLADQAQELYIQKRALEIQRDEYFKTQKVAQKKSQQNKLLYMANSRLKAWILGGLEVADLTTRQTYKELQQYKRIYGWQASPTEKELESALRRNIFFALRAARSSPYIRQILSAPLVGYGHSKEGKRPVVAAHSTANKIAVVENQESVTIYEYGPAGIHIEKQLSLSTEGEPILNAVFQPGSANLALFTPSGIRLYDWVRGELSKSISDLTFSAHAPCFDADGRYMASLSADGRIWLWETTHWNRRELKGAYPAFPAQGGNHIVIAFSPNAELIAAGDSAGSIRVWRTANTESFFRKILATSIKAGTNPHQGAEIVGIGFTPDAKGVVTVSRSLDGIRYWPIANKSADPVNIQLSPAAIESADRMKSFSRLAKKVGSADHQTKNNRGPDRESYDSLEQEHVVASAFDRNDPLLHFAICLNNGSGFILRAPNPGTVDASKSPSLEMHTDFVRFPKAPTKLEFISPKDETEDNAFDKLVGVAGEGEVFIVDDVPEQDRIEALKERGLDSKNVDPEAFAKYVCHKAWRNLTQEEWDQFVPDEPYQCTCPQFGPGFGIDQTECPTFPE